MSIPPPRPPQPGSPDPWYPASGNGQGPSHQFGAPSQGPPYGSPYGPPSNGSPYGAPPPSNAHGAAYGFPPGQQPPTQNGSGGGGAVKWLVIGCLGCAGIAVLGFLALILLAALGGGGDGPTPTSTTSVETGVSDGGGEATDAAEEEAPDDESEDEKAPDDDSGEEKAPADPAGVTAETGAVKVTVLSTERTQELQDSLWESTTSNEYVVIDISYTNKSSESLDLWANDIVLVDSEGKEYEANTDVSLAVETPIIIEEINPGLTIEGTLVYEVPPGTEFTELHFEESYGTGEAVTIDFK
jgi:hypothetical protein